MNLMRLMIDLKRIDGHFLVEGGMTIEILIAQQLQPTG